MANCKPPNLDEGKHQHRGEEDEAHHSKLQPDIQVRVVSLIVGHVVAHNQTLVGFDARHPVRDPTPTLQRSLPDEAQYGLPNIQASGHIWALADNHKELCAVNQNEERSNAEAGPRQPVVAVSSLAIVTLCDQRHQGNDGRANHRETDASRAGKRKRRGGHHQTEDVGNATARLDRQADGKHDESEHRDVGEQVGISDDALDSGALEQPALSPVVGPGWWYRPGVVLEDRSDWPANDHRGVGLKGEGRRQDEPEDSGKKRQ